MEAVKVGKNSELWDAGTVAVVCGHHFALSSATLASAAAFQLRFGRTRTSARRSTHRRPTDTP